MPGPEPIEPTCVARLFRNGWPSPAIATLLNIPIPRVAQALLAADQQERGVADKSLLAYQSVKRGTR